MQEAVHSAPERPDADRESSLSSRVGLVLEGGDMRAAYTAGVVDAFLDAGIDIPYVIGVSAGANAGSAYVSRQRERGRRVFVESAADRRYAGFANLVRERNWFGMRFLFETLERLPALKAWLAQRSASACLMSSADG